MSDSPQMNSLDCWDYTIELECLQGSTDLQLAAELGKTLLERNKELETTIKGLQGIIDDQAQEIEYLTKQTTALREVNDSRLRIYEQLEVSISDLERANHHLVVESTTDKKKLKTLTATVETLENKCEELQSVVDDLKIENECYKRKLQTRAETPKNKSTDKSCKHEIHSSCSADSTDSPVLQKASSTPSPKQEPNDSKKKIEPPTCEKSANKVETPPTGDEIEQISQLMGQLRELRSQSAKDQRRIAELEDQVSTYVEQNRALENRLVNLHFKEEEAKSMHEELTTLEEVRQGQLCSRCLRTIDDSPKMADGNSMSLCDELEDDDISMVEAVQNYKEHRSSFTLDIQTPPNNPYRDLVEKYEALVEIQKNESRKSTAKPLTLQEELQLSGDLNKLKEADEESGHGSSSLKMEKQKTRKNAARTPTDFSEAETSSSGFSDEISNKATQTDGRPGSFLCTIADGEDKLSIYDDASPIESRFRNRPEYRNLFKEIFTVLKKAAKNKEENEELPLLDDNSPIRETPKVPPVTPCNDSFPDFPDNLTDDTQSVLSSTISEFSTSQVEPPTVVENVKEENKPETREEPILKPLIKQPLDYISVSVNVRKRSSSRRKKHNADRSDSPATIIVGSPKITYTNRPSSGRRRRNNNACEAENWNGNTLQFWSSNRRNMTSSPTPSQKAIENSFEFKPSAASQDLHKLKSLDKSYAEVLKYSSKKRQSKRQ